MMRITTPVEGFTGTVVDVVFTDGVGETTDPGALAYFRRHGYKVEAAEKSSKGKKEPKSKDSTPQGEETETHDGQNPNPDSSEGTDDQDDDATVTVPGGNAAKQAWYDYALATGVSEDDLDGLGRDEIRELVAG